MTREKPRQDSRSRLDVVLVEKGWFSSRSRARDAILRGTVTVGGVAATRPGMPVPVDADIAVEDPARAWVSRSALKLEAALDRFGLDPAGRSCLDIGASTGGFTQMLLARGAAHVTAIDVGHGQLDQALRDDPRVTAIEGLNARDLKLSDLGGVAPELIVCDVSFVSLRLVLGPALELAAPGASGVFLVKPQFEAGREAIGKGGLLRDPGQGERIAAELAAWLDKQPGWRPLGIHPSPIRGGDGNQEYLLAGVRQ